ncbi:lytic transglycosylase domain-containing protein [Solihabitans fulvus]|uniref:Lytic transglycosylase domain-containing protein n=1 Tax=Solihabitans fulvus TaxID=1892852 RepID=A0A5B2WXN3_9PSEU|nr:lytic transglycosylase domain-containing protein [Solihabitans fulvus]KAA2255660.1 lytic transglycosylase domain-containing protein [Solihabitans fulvus]
MRKSVRSGRAASPRQIGLAATAAATLLAPALLTGSGVMSWVNLANGTRIVADPAAPGDLHRKVRTPFDLSKVNVNGRLPQTDELSAQLLKSADNPSELAGETNPLINRLPQGPLGIPGVVLDAYLKAQDRLAATMPGCHLSWSLLAGIGRIESGHARGGLVDVNGTTLSPILGPVLNGGPGMAAIPDTDGGRYDGDSTWDRAVGPMQFIPSTWAGYTDRIQAHNGGVPNPHNVYDAAQAAAYYLCSAGGDLSNPVERAKAVFRYNHSDEYVSTVLIWADAYAVGVTPLPSSTAPIDITGPAQQIGQTQPGTTPGQSTGTPNQPAGTPTAPTTTNPSPGSATTTAPPSSTSGTLVPTAPSTSTPPSSTTTTPSCPTTPAPTSTTTSTPPTSTTTPSSPPPGCPTPTTTTTTPSGPSSAARSDATSPTLTPSATAPSATGSSR